ncbi:phytanoyl-CoA dioxygenase family protein [Chondromyces apiculatus]|uniref:Phytanoyl-CoA dioxygenase n=1 Tax=Chondromyces apiculatus DSM 436 TaxID=1192034 RepID=A0A017SUC6_9BACT|nr:phytanoyl-CoA dioxygenase family protein [Chondromyces apiculatus]EYF00563.1 Phytanoyl-CoA dioxygenase [Chondromyces apiculatus DSM 436]
MLPPLDHRISLSRDQIAAFRSDGYLVMRQAAPPDDIRRYASAVEDASARFALPRRAPALRDTYARAFIQTFNAWAQDEQVRRLVFAPCFARAAAELLGVPAVRILCDELLLKEPGSGHTPWHQDHSACPFDTDLGIAVWIPLHDVPVEMGGMYFARGSHLLGELGPHDISDATDVAFEAVVRERGLPRDELGAMRVGDVSFHHAWMVHGAHPNRTDQMRAVLVVHYMADGVRLGKPGNPSKARLAEMLAPGQAPGDLATGDLVPIIPF